MLVSDSNFLSVCVRQHGMPATELVLPLASLKTKFRDRVLAVAYHKNSPLTSRFGIEPFDNLSLILGALLCTSQIGPPSSSVPFEKSSTVGNSCVMSSVTYPYHSRSKPCYGTSLISTASIISYDPCFPGLLSVLQSSNSPTPFSATFLAPSWAARSWIYSGPRALLASNAVALG